MSTTLTSRSTLIDAVQATPAEVRDAVIRLASILLAVDPRLAADALAVLVTLAAQHGVTGLPIDGPRAVVAPVLTINQTGSSTDQAAWDAAYDEHVAEWAAQTPGGWAQAESNRYDHHADPAMADAWSAYVAEVDAQGWMD